MNELIRGPWAIAEAYLPAAYHAFRQPAPHAAAAPDPIREGATVIIPLQGMMTPRGSFFGASTNAFADAVRLAADSPKIDAIVLDVASPGGSTFGVEEAAAAVFEARQKKPVVAVSNHMTASAAYWVASQASSFYASPSAIVGSVGVYTMHIDQSKAMEDWGVKVTLVSAGPKKVDGNPFEPLSDAAKADLQASVDHTYQQFLSAIARGRGESVSGVEAKHGRGAVVDAQPALAAGMIDGVMTLREAVEKLGSSRTRLALMRRRADADAALYAI